MRSVPTSRILFATDDATSGDACIRALEEAGHSVHVYRLDAAAPVDVASYHLVVIDAGSPMDSALVFCKRLRACLGDGFSPVLLLTSESNPAARLAGFEAGADVCLLRPADSDEIVAQAHAVLRIKSRCDRLADRTEEVHRMNQQLQLFHQRVNDELEMARRIQMSFLPRTLPEIPQLRFGVHYRPCGRVGGDFYDVFRLDENHVGFYIADAMGHGVPASLLTMFLKKGVRSKEIYQNQYRLVPPDEVLERLNRDLIDQGLADNPFITMVYALVNFQEGTVQFSRAGHPHPLYLPASGEPILWKAPGTLLGVFDTHFTVQTHQLAPGDKVLFYTDGTDSVSFESQPPGADSLLTCAALHRSLPIIELVDRVARDLSHQTNQPDDFTLLGLEFRG